MVSWKDKVAFQDHRRFQADDAYHGFLSHVGSDPIIGSHPDGMPPQGRGASKFQTCRFEMAFKPMDRARFTVGKAIDEMHSISARQTLIPRATIKYGNPIGPVAGQVPALDGRQGVANSSANKAGTGRRSCGRDGSDRPVQAGKDRVPGNTTATISIC